MALFFLFLTLFTLNALTVDDKFYLMMESDSEGVAFSSYRLNNPDRVVLETSGDFPEFEFKPEGTVKSMTRSLLKGDVARFVFEIEEGTYYTVLNRGGSIIIGFGKDVFSELQNYETILAKFIEKGEELRQIARRKTEVEAETSDVEPLLKPKPQDESAMAAKLLKNLEEEPAKVAKAEIQLETPENAEPAKVAKAEIQLETPEIAEPAKVAKLETQSETPKIAEPAKVSKTEIRPETPKNAEPAKVAKAEIQPETPKNAEPAKVAKAEIQPETPENAEPAKVAKAEIQLETPKNAEPAKVSKLETQPETPKNAEPAKVAKLETQPETPKNAEPAKVAKLETRPETPKNAEPAKAEKEMEERSLLTAKKSIKTGDGEIRCLKVVKAGKGEILGKIPRDLPLVKLEKRGTLKNIFFRKFPEFSRVTMEVSGDADYTFREIKGGFVIDVFNFTKIPRYLLNIIDARAFKAEVDYIFPKKSGKTFKIYIKTAKGMAVRKSKEGKYINFDFFKPEIE